MKTKFRVPVGTQNPCAADTANSTKVELKSIFDIRWEYTQVTEYRKLLENLLNFDGVHHCDVRIGGSYALKCYMKEYMNKEVHDYDFIVFGDKEYAVNLMRKLSRLGKVYPIRYYDDNTGYTVGEICGKRAEILFCDIPNAEPSWGEFNSLPNICMAKLSYIKDAIKRGRLPREKDIRDCYLILKDIGTVRLLDTPEEKLPLNVFLYYANIANAMNDEVRVAYPILSKILLQK